MTDVWRFKRWAQEIKTGSPTKKAVLMALAVTASPESGRCETRMATLGEWVEISEQAISRNLRALEEAGLIARRPQYRIDGGQRNSEFLLLAPWVTEWPDGAPVGGGTPREAGGPPPLEMGQEVKTTPGEIALTGESKGQTQKDRTQKDKREIAREAAKRPPPDFPDELRPHANAVMRILKEVAEAQGAREVLPFAVGHVIMAHPGRHYVAEAHALAAWATTAPRPIKDVVATYRNWLGRADRFEGIESLNGNGRRRDVDTDFEALIRHAGRIRD